MYNAHLVQFVFNRSGVSVFVKEGIGYDKAAFLSHDSAEFIQSNRHAAFFEINFFRCSNPEHILSPFGNGFDVDQMFYAYVLGNGVAAPGTAAKGKGWSQFKVV